MSKPCPPPRPRACLPFRWAHPPFKVVLVEPEIPPNTGNIARMCAATGSELHLIEPMGFTITDAALRRAGLDYWPHVHVEQHPHWEAFLQSVQPQRLHLFTTMATRSLYQTEFQAGDALVFGCETRGLSLDLLAQHPEQQVGIPQQTGLVRSMNLANTASIAVFEALRQLQS